VRRILAACLGAALLPAPAMAQTVEEQYQAAVQAFVGGIADRPDYLIGYATVIFEGVDGRWYDGGFFGGDPRGEALDIACGPRGIDIDRRDAYSLAMTRERGTPREVVTTYTVRSGNSFGRYIDARTFVEAYGLDDLPDAHARADAMAHATGLVTIDRPSADIVVIREPGAAPSILVRCPG
jgi:hypothetical protein